MTVGEEVLLGREHRILSHNRREPAYSKGHSRSLFADLTLSQDLSGLLKGLGSKLSFSL